MPYCHIHLIQESRDRQETIVGTLSAFQIVGHTGLLFSFKTNAKLQGGPASVVLCYSSDFVEAEFQQPLSFNFNRDQRGADYLGTETTNYVLCSMFGVEHATFKVRIVELAGAPRSD